MAAYSLPKRLVHWYAVAAASSVLLLICSGGLVTSHEAGMSVPDWPNSFGYNMFLFPISRWVGAVFFEHTHRLIASGVGLLTVILSVALFIVEDRRWVKILGLVAVAAVIVQGVLGGLRVTENNALLGLFHGCLAQSFFALMATIALATSRFWRTLSSNADARWLRSIRLWTMVVTGMVFVQLVLGASMRHSHAGLSIPDFPTSYGRIVPPLDDATLAKINEARGAAAQPYTSAGLILLQLVHRIWAVVIIAGLLVTAVRLLRNQALPAFFRQAAGFWVFLVVVQFGLGAWTVLSNKAADIATAHVMCGALTLMIGVLLCVALTGLLGCFPGDKSHFTGQRSIELKTV